LPFHSGNLAFLAASFCSSAFLLAGFILQVESKLDSSFSKRFVVKPDPLLNREVEAHQPIGIPTN
jgi:hypothetical protein